MFYISNKTFFSKKKICFAIFVIQMKNERETKKQKRSPSLRWGPTEEKEIQMQHTGL